MLQTLPNELILSIAGHVKSPATLAQTCHTCYSAVLPLVWRHLPFETLETFERVLETLGRRRTELATRFVHTISLRDPRRHYYTKQDIQKLLLGAVLSYYDDDDGDKGVVRPSVSSFDQAIARLLTQFPKTSALVLDYDLAVPYLVEQVAQVTTTTFDGALTVVHYRSGPNLTQLLAPFPGLIELIVQAQPAPSISEDPGTWVLSEMDLEQLDLPMLQRLTLHLLDPMIPLDAFLSLLDMHPSLSSLTLHWQYPIDKDRIAQSILKVRPGRAVHHPTQLILFFY